MVDENFPAITAASAVKAALTPITIPAWDAIKAGVSDAFTSSFFRKSGSMGEAALPARLIPTVTSIIEMSTGELVTGLMSGMRVNLPRFVSARGGVSLSTHLKTIKDARPRVTPVEKKAAL